MGGRLAQRESMRDSGAFSMTGMVVFGERRSRSVVKGSEDDRDPLALPDLSELRKF